MHTVPICILMNLDYCVHTNVWMTFYACYITIDIYVYIHISIYQHIHNFPSNHFLHYISI